MFWYLITSIGSLCWYLYLVVYDHHVVAVCAKPGVHGLADAADLVQCWGVVVRPAKVQDLDERIRERVRERDREKGRERERYKKR